MEQGTGTCSTFETKKKDRPFQTAPIFLSHTRAYAQRGGNCRQYANDDLNHSLPILFLHNSFFFLARMAADGHGYKIREIR